MAKRKPSKKTVRDAIRASVPDGKLKNARILLREINQSEAQIGGFTEYDPKRKGEVCKIAAPLSDDAFGITVRGHECGHASIHGLKRKKPMTQNEAIASQLVDDVNNETRPLPNVSIGMREYKRDHLAVAMRDLRAAVNVTRAVRAGKVKDQISIRNGNLMAAVRILAMTNHYRVGIGGGKTRINAIASLRDVVGGKTLSAVGEVVRLGRSPRTRSRAISMLVSLMEEERPDMEESDEERPKTEEESDMLEPVVEGGAINGHMRITDLRPKSVFCAKEKQITRKAAPNGVLINPARFVNAIASGDPSGLFSRRLRMKAGGTVVIDASGSMGACKKSLSALCKLIPTATVAYYSGEGSEGKGELVIYAYEGRRFNGELPEMTMHGGNAVDLPAIKWLLKRAKPHVLVSDLEFCGGVIGSEQIAHALVERGEHRGELTVHRSLDAAFEAFGGKGGLPHDGE